MAIAFTNQALYYGGKTKDALDDPIGLFGLGN